MDDVDASDIALIKGIEKLEATEAGFEISLSSEAIQAAGFEDGDLLMTVVDEEQDDPGIVLVPWVGDLDELPDDLE